jgi:hypothetical protein
MKHLRTFESFSKSTEDETKDFLDQFGEDSDAANTIGIGVPCTDCNCVVEECNCGCKSCKTKQKHGVSFKREPYKQDYTPDKKDEITK